MEAHDQAAEVDLAAEVHSQGFEGSVVVDMAFVDSGTADEEESECNILAYEVPVVDTPVVAADPGQNVRPTTDEVEHKPARVGMACGVLGVEAAVQSAVRG